MFNGKRPTERRVDDFIVNDESHIVPLGEGKWNGLPTNKERITFTGYLRISRSFVYHTIRGVNLGHKYWGGKKFLKVYFKKKIFKSSLQFSKKNSDDLFFFSHWKFFSKKCTLFIENVQIYFLFFVFFFFLSLCFCFLSCLLF